MKNEVIFMKHIGCYACPFGYFRIEEEAGKVIVIDVVKEKTESVSPSPVTDEAAQELAEYLAGRRRVFTIPYEFRGTPFRLQVWRELAKVPYGTTTTYKKLAEAIGRPGAYHAVGRCRRGKSLEHPDSVPSRHRHKRQPHRLCLGTADEKVFTGVGTAALIFLSERRFLEDAGGDDRDDAVQDAFGDETGGRSEAGSEAVIEQRAEKRVGCGHPDGSEQEASEQADSTGCFSYPGG
jgi:hypothetical protein